MMSRLVTISSYAMPVVVLWCACSLLRLETRLGSADVTSGSRQLYCSEH